MAATMPTPLTTLKQVEPLMADFDNTVHIHPAKNDKPDKPNPKKDKWKTTLIIVVGLIVLFLIQVIGMIVYAQMFLNRLGGV